MKIKSRQSGRTVTIIGKDGDYRFFVFNDHSDIIVQHPINTWDEYFKEKEEEE